MSPIIKTTHPRGKAPELRNLVKYLEDEEARGITFVVHSEKRDGEAHVHGHFLFTQERQVQP